MGDPFEIRQDTILSVRGLVRAAPPRSRLSKGGPTHRQCRENDIAEVNSIFSVPSSGGDSNIDLRCNSPRETSSSSSSSLLNEKEVTSSGVTSSSACNAGNGNVEDAVKVIIRVRPHSERESSLRETSGSTSTGSVVQAHADGTVALCEPGRQEPYVVLVDCALGETSSQEDVYHAVGSAMVDHCMAGFNSTIFAYGQTGSGKTHTMLGEAARGGDGALHPGCGLTPRVFEALFAAIASKEQTAATGGGTGRSAKGSTSNKRATASVDASVTAGQSPAMTTLRYSVKCSFLEIYNEEVTDLLDPGSTGLQVRDGDVKKGVYVQGLSETEVLNADDVLGVIASGSENRRMAATRMNERSSRSHSVFTATIEAHERSATGIIKVRYAKLNLIDLAGSERVGRSGATGEQLTEAKSINRSLTVLGRVISALVERQKRPAMHVPYRDSRLTFLLQESLGGNSRTAIVATVSPAVDSAFETYSTLAFAAGAKKMKCRAVVNEDRVADSKALTAENTRLTKLVEELSARPTTEELQSLRRQLEQSQALFDQNNGAIASLTAEQGLLRRHLTEATAVAARFSEEAVSLRGDNAALAHALEAAEEEVQRLREDLAVAAEERRVATATATAALEAEKGEVASLRAEIAAAKDDASRITAEIRTLQSTKAAAEAMVEEARGEVARLQIAAREDSAAAAAREERLRQEADTARAKMHELADHAQTLQHDLSGESSSVAKYRRMVGEIGRLIDWAQASAPGSAAAAAALSAARAKGKAAPGSKPSAAAAAALRVARMSLATPLGDTSNMVTNCNGRS